MSEVNEGAKRSLDDLSKQELIVFVQKLKVSHKQLKATLEETQETKKKSEEQANELKKKLLDLIPKTKQFQVCMFASINCFFSV